MLPVSKSNLKAWDLPWKESAYLETKHIQERNWMHQETFLKLKCKKYKIKIDYIAR